MQSQPLLLRLALSLSHSLHRPHHRGHLARRRAPPPRARCAGSSGSGPLRGGGGGGWARHPGGGTDGAGVRAGGRPSPRWNRDASGIGRSGPTPSRGGSPASSASMDTEDDNRKFWLDPVWQGWGLMTEACTATAEFWFGTPVPLEPRAEANVASRHVSTKSGMRVIRPADAHRDTARPPHLMRAGIVTRPPRRKPASAVLQSLPSSAMPPVRRPWRHRSLQAPG